jgi:hypothetical protein
MARTYTDTNRDTDVPREETYSLIASDKVEGTAVYGPDREKIGSVDNLMIDKRSGRVAYAVLSFGGFLGMGTEHYPLPWSVLRYDENLGGYMTNITKDQLNGAPNYGDNEDWDWNDEGHMGRVEAHYRSIAFI